MRRNPLSVLQDRDGAAAVELALVIPFLLIIMLGAVDLGNYFASEHVLAKSVRDAARFAARLPFADYSGCAVASGGTAEQQTQRLARFGDPSGTGTARLAGWTADDMTTVEISCDTDTSHSYVNSGIYTDFPNGGEAPTITVSAKVPYSSLFGAIGLGSVTLNLNAKSEAAVIGA